METYRKSYKELVWWMVLFCGGVLVLPFLPLGDGGVITRVLLVFIALGLAVLAYIIYRTESVYWYNGTSFEEAEAAGSARRRAFALAHLKHFAWCAVGMAAFCGLSQALGWPFWIDMVLGFAAIVAAAVSTIRIRL